jgi:pyridoxal phosphate enzyme (YggS family)
VRREAISANYHTVIERIHQAAKASGRDPDAVRMVVVTKGHPFSVIQAVISAGAQIIGENYPEQAVEKMKWLGPQESVEWHMIGHIQSRKARLVCSGFSLVHSLDSQKLAERLNDCAREKNITLPVLLEINLGGEESKFGWKAATEEEMEKVIPELASVILLPNLKVKGLMGMPPISDNPEASRPYFLRLRNLGEIFIRQLPQANWDELSMGTSFDYEVAVQEGATLVRVGQAILGPRLPRE